MKPLLLQGHERAITQIKYNREGDLLFSAAKDKLPNVWFSINGERLGTFNGHQGAVWCIDVDWQTINFLSGSADSTCKLWDCKTGTTKSTYTTFTPVRTCSFSFSGNLIFYSTDKSMGKDCSVFVRDVRMSPDDAPIKKFDVTPKFSKVTSAVWGPLEETIITGHEGGELLSWDMSTGKLMSSTKPHRQVITDLQTNNENTLLISSSKDTTAKLFDIDTLKELKCYKSEKPVNSAAISPILDHVLIGGGQEAIDAAIHRGGKFDAKFYHLIFEEEFARVKDHFGPINSVAFHPDGKSYSSGGEDGFVRVHVFDKSYFEFNFEC